MNRKFGLIGYPLSHTFSPAYFKSKFKKEKIKQAEYAAYQLADAAVLRELMILEKMEGMNVTIPHKESVIPFLDTMSPAAKAIGAVNTITFRNGKLKGYNTDVYGFEISLLELIGKEKIEGALVLGTGGASKAVAYVLKKLKIKFKFVSRSSKKGLTYHQLKGKLAKFQLIINTTPVGMSPNDAQCPNLPYKEMTQSHFCYDLIYNPQKTLFLTKAEQQGASIYNGHKMLILQAERSWEIWNSTN